MVGAKPTSIDVSRRCYAEKKAQMLRRLFRVKSAKTNLRNIRAKLSSVEYTINTQKSPPNSTQIPCQ
jgi:hypothetical protein